MKDIFDRIYTERCRTLKKSQREMDDYVGVSVGTTYKLESGRISNINTILKYLNKLGLSIGIVKKG